MKAGKAGESEDSPDGIVLCAREDVYITCLAEEKGILDIAVQSFLWKECVGIIAECK